MDIDELKSNWKAIELRVNKLEAQNRQLAEKMSKNKATTIKQRIASQFLTQAILCLFCPIWIFWFDLIIPVSLTLKVIYTLFFIIMILVKLYIWQNLKKTDFMTITVKDALIAVFHIENLIKNEKILGYILCIPVLGLFFWEIGDCGNKAIIIGGLIGLILGVLCGLYLQYRLNKQLREMHRSFEEELSEDCA